MRSSPAEEGALLEIGREFFNEKLAGAFPFADEATRTQGVAYLVSHPVPPAAQPLHRLYVRGMYVTDRRLGLAPAYAPFLRVVANTNGLRVNAAREDLIGQEEEIESVRQSVGSAFVRWLGELGTTEPRRLEEIVLAQYEAFLAGAKAGRVDLLGHLRRSFPLRTSRGRMSIEQILRRFGRIEFIEDERDWHRVEVKAMQEGHGLVRADDRISHDLLGAVSEHQPEIPIVLLTAAEYLSRFRHAAETRGAEEERFIWAVAAELKTECCRLDFAEAEDPYEIATLEMDDEESILRQFRTLDQGPDDQHPPVKTLRLNRSHPVIEQLLTGTDLPTEQLRAWVRLAYHQGLLNAREAATAGEIRRQARALLTLYKATTGIF